MKGIVTVCFTTNQKIKNEVHKMKEIIVTKDNFEEEVLKSEKSVLIDFWATWCGPCRMLGPIIEKIATEHDEIKVCKVNVDEEIELANAFQVTSIPMLAVVKNGNLVNTAVGFMPEEKILELLQ